MAQKGKTAILILKGLLVLDGKEYHKGSTAEVDLSVLEWLKGKKSHTLDFSVVKGDKPKAATAAPTDKGPADQGTTGASNQAPDSLGAGSEEDPEGGDEDLDGDQDGDQGQDGDQDGGNADQAAQTVLGLKSVDAALEARLAEAGLDSLEKLREISVGKLTTLKGVGKLRAEAIKQEVGAL